MKRFIIIAFFSFLPGALLGAGLAFFSTPFFWTLERRLGIELAGHSGPAPWVLQASALAGWILVGGFFLLLPAKRRAG